MKKYLLLALNILLLLGVINFAYNHNLVLFFVNLFLYSLSLLLVIMEIVKEVLKKERVIKLEPHAGITTFKN
jgi:uncharacterized membrane protein